MPVTTRYSASLDRTYEDGGDQTKQQSQPPPPPPPPPHPQPAPCSSPSNYQSEWENGDRAMRSDISVGNSMEDGLSDSMDSLALDDDSNSSASGHSRQHSSDGGSSISPAYPTRPLSNLRPSGPVFNPLQFVKTAASPLVKQAEAQMKQYEEVKKVKELVKEEAEEWQSNLDIWKNRRRLVSQKSVQRAEETKQIEEELDKKRRKSKTFSEMMEERSKRGPSKSLPSVFSEDDWSPQVPLAVEEDLDDPAQHEQSSQNGNGVNQNGKNKSTTPSNGHNRAEKEQPLSGFEEAIRSYAEYAEETNNRARTKLGSGNGNTASETYTNEEPEVVETSESQRKINDRTTKEFKEEKEEVLSRDPGATLTLSVHLRRQSDQKDFGFSIKSVKGVGTGAFVETVQPQSPAATAGLQVNDELLAINGEKCTSDRSHSAIVFAIKQAVYTGQLHLTIYRYDNPASVLQNPKSTNVREVNNSRITEDSPKVDVGKRRSLFERAVSPERAAIHRRSLDMSYSLKDKAASFEGNHSRAKSTERLNTKVEKHGNGDVSSVDDSHPQVGSGLKCGFELASTLQETPIVDSAPSSPLLEPQIEMDFDLMREEILVVVNEEPLNQSVKPPEPPKEKPPPPPPPQVSECDPAADPAFNKTVKLRRVESTKRIRSEISKRRSNFLGIEDDEFQKQLEHEMSQVSPPPNADEILLKMEKELLAVNTTGSDISDHSIQEIESSLLSPTSSSMTNVDDIDQKEREIIESLEQWEEEQKLKVAGSEVVEAEKVVTHVPVAATAVKMVLGQTNESPVNEITRNDKVLEEKELLLKQQEERLRSEKEKLRREQEELMRQKEEYEKQIQRIQQQQIQMAAVQVGLHVEQLPVAPKTKSPQVTATESLRPSLSKGPPPPIMTKPKLNEGSSFSSTDEESSSPPQFQPQILTKPNLVAISAPPKAKLMDGEEWMHRKKRENYHQHWLVQEAEFRRLQAASQMKESEPSPLAEDRLVVQAPSSPSKHHVIDIEGSPQQRSPLRQVSAPNGLSDGKTQGHLQKPAPRPPAKPVFHQPSSSVVDRRSLPPLSPKVNPPPPPPPPLNQLSSASASNDTQILSVSGKKRCSHCGIELGRGAAMIIESLQLFYHIGCFKCCVCHVQLGNGSSGTDVRVRSQKLHCHNCYSNDEGLKFSKV